MIKKYFFLLTLVPILVMILFDYEYSLQKNSYNLAYAHIFPGTPNSEFVKKDGYQVPYKFYVFADMSYPYMFK
ncbi:MAG TPA: hypothetical protein VFV86_00730, partial [Nitrososphaeraceae archaeon]|nr:hypothetical protein [Nitrososphaeraceae archaeon]